MSSPIAALTVGDMSAPSAHKRHVAIAGGGVAGIELALALRSIAGTSIDLTLVMPNDELHYRPLAVVEPFGRPAPRRYPLDAICRDLGMTWRRDELREVDVAAHAITTKCGERIAYDDLAIAIGAHPRPALPHAHTFLADTDADSLHWLVSEVEQGWVKRVAFVVPAATGWSLPLYELALMTAARAREAGIDDLSLMLVTPEDVPLAAFRGAGSDAVAALLDEAGIAVLPSTYVREYDGRQLELTPGGGSLPVDRVVALPALVGPAIAGLPCDAEGFVHVDEHGRVPGALDVFAIGDATTFPIKQGGVASQEADVAAALIARAAGLDVSVPRSRPLLRAVMLTGGEPLYLRATIAGGESVASSASRHCPWWPPHKIAARHLAPYLADREETDPATARRHALAAKLGGEAATIHADGDATGIELLGRDA
jgi:sulfide:quinone oxidoreductase